MCTPLESVATGILDATLASARVDCAPLHRELPDGSIETIWVLRGWLPGGEMTILGRIYPPYEADAFIKSILDILPEGVRDAYNSNHARRALRIEDQFPDDPAHPSRKNSPRKEPEPDVDTYELLRRLMAGDADSGITS